MLQEYIVGKITSITSQPNDPTFGDFYNPNVPIGDPVISAQVECSYQAAHPVNPASFAGTALVVATMAANLTDTEMESFCRARIAAFVNSVTARSFTETDVRGCKF